MGYCADCLFSELTPLSHHLNIDSFKCVNENSAYYNSVVNSNNTCRLFVDALEVIKQSDRLNKIDKLIDKNKWK